MKLREGQDFETEVPVVYNLCLVIFLSQQNAFSEIDHYVKMRTFTKLSQTYIFVFVFLMENKKHEIG